MEVLKTNAKLKGFGNTTRFEFSNGSKIYINNKGWTVTVPNIKKGITINWSEIQVAIEETIALGYFKK